MASNLFEATEENYGELNSQFDEMFAMTSAAEDYKDDLEGAIEDAKDGNDDAELYLLNKCKKMIFYVFWTNFIGKEASKNIAKIRIANGEFEDFLALVYIAFDKAIKAFKPSAYDNMKLGNFQYYLGRYLKAEAISWNTKEKEDPTADSIRPDGMTSETESKGAGTGNAWDTLVGGTEDESTADFIEDWKLFAKSPELNEPLSKKVKTPRKKVLAQVLTGKKSIPDIAKDLDVTKTTIYTAISDVGKVLKDYGIDQQTMAKVLKTDPDAILKPLNEAMYAHTSHPARMAGIGVYKDGITKEFADNAKEFYGFFVSVSGDDGNDYCLANDGTWKVIDMDKSLSDIMINPSKEEVADAIAKSYEEFAGGMKVRIGWKEPIEKMIDKLFRKDHYAPDHRTVHMEFKIPGASMKKVHYYSDGWGGDYDEYEKYPYLILTFSLEKVYTDEDIPEIPEDYFA